jgi:hypothetical protein
VFGALYWSLRSHAVADSCHSIVTSLTTHAPTVAPLLLQARDFPCRGVLRLFLATSSLLGALLYVRFCAPAAASVTQLRIRYCFNCRT